jgi:hypothetical protein
VVPLRELPTIKIILSEAKLFGAEVSKGDNDNYVNSEYD